MIAVAVIAGYLIGSAPTANGLARLWGVNLRTSGTRNPGANNAMRVGGPALSALVLITEVAKGALAVVAGLALAGDLGAALSGVAAAAGNVYNVWYRFEGGKGLAITGGLLLAAWPTLLPIAVAVIVVVTVMSRSSGLGALVTMGVIAASSVVWAFLADLPTGWGLVDRRALPVLALGIAVVLVGRHLHDARHPLSEPSRR